MEFSEEAKAIIKLIESSEESLFITGKAGTGKSTLLEYVHSRNSDFIVLAPTGIAAIHVNGDTIHSFFQLKPGFEYDEAKHVRINYEMRARYAKIETIIIDEVSMVRADILDAIDIFLRRVRDSEIPFAGIRMIFFGDLFQLPPVLTLDEEKEFHRRYRSPYFFSAHVFIQTNLFVPPFTLKKCELNTIYRQKDPVFTNLLNAIRVNKIDEGQLSQLNQQVNRDIEDEEFLIHLVSTNSIAKRINLGKLEAITGPPIVFHAYHTGNIENLKPNDYEVKLKKDAQIVFLNNDSLKRWMNGTIGRIIHVGDKLDEETQENYKYLEIELENGTSVEVLPFTWEISKYIFRSGKFERVQIGTFTQIPVKLAWAITIHKSQGKTFNKVKIDLGRGSFAHGQTYVALSRCKTLSNISLSKPIAKSDIIIDERVIEFAKS